MPAGLSRFISVVPVVHSGTRVPDLAAGGGIALRLLSHLEERLERSEEQRTLVGSFDSTTLVTNHAAPARGSGRRRLYLVGDRLGVDRRGFDSHSVCGLFDASLLEMIDSANDPKSGSGG